MPENILTIREVADLLKINEKTVYKLAAASKIPGMKVGGSWRFDLATITSWIRTKAASGMDAADDWIVERVAKGDIVITADIPLASRCVKAGAEVIAPNGKLFTEQSIGMTLAVRNLMTDLRSSGEVTGGPRSFAPRDRSAFLSSLDQTIRRIQRQRDQSAPNQN